MPYPLHNRGFAVATALVILVIIYGSLYPFVFRVPAAGLGPLPTLLGSWNKRPGMGDFLSNILLYIPLGFSAAFALRPSLGRAGGLLAVLALGIGLSVTMELTQYYDAGRDTEATDVYSNALGTVLGALGSLFTGDLLKPSSGWGRKVDPAALMFVVIWCGFRLFPYVPTIDLHKYWDALKPVFLYPSLSAYGLFRHIAMWLTISMLLSGVVGRRSALWVFPGFIGAVLVAKVLIIDATLSVTEIAGAVIALGLWFILGGRRGLRTVSACLLLGAYVVAERLEPFTFQAQGRDFGWIPFLGFMEGSVEINVMSFLEKSFFYGSLVWLLNRAGFKLRSATLATALTLFVTSLLETHLPGRSAEITDALMALLLGGAIALARSYRGWDAAPAAISVRPARS